MALQQELNDFSLPLDQTGWEKLERFHAFLLAKNAVMDLTNVPEAEMPLRHYADSLLVLNHALIHQGAQLIDVGTGAGFPGIPLAIARPDIKVALLESMQKRCDFLLDAVSMLHLDNVKVVMGRAEEKAQAPLRENFDLALARAVAKLPVLAEYLLPYVKIGGKALCWKGPAVKEELQAGQSACQLLGGQMGNLIDLNIPGRSHYIQEMAKVSATPKKYPRKAGIPAKKPLA